MMSDKMIENNQVSIVGEVVSDFSFSHEVFGEGFYMLDVSVKTSERFLRCDTADDFRKAGECERRLPGRLYPGGGPVPFLQPP